MEKLDAALDNMSHVLCMFGPDNLVAQFEDGRIINVSYRPTQNGRWVSTHEDITERAQNEARIAHLAFHDQLTGLPNQAAFNEPVANILSDATGNASFAVLCVDLDQRRSTTSTAIRPATGF